MHSHSSCDLSDCFTSHSCFYRWHQNKRRPCLCALPRRNITLSNRMHCLYDAKPEDVTEGGLWARARSSPDHFPQPPLHGATNGLRARADVQVGHHQGANEQHRHRCCANSPLLYHSIRSSYELVYGPKRQAPTVSNQLEEHVTANGQYYYHCTHYRYYWS